MHVEHPHRKKSLVYFAIPLLLIITFVAAGVSANNFDDKSHMNHVLGTLSGASFLLTFIFIIPFLIYAVKYWRSKVVPLTLPPADAQPHLLPVSFSTSLLARIFGNVGSKRGTLSWVNSEKVLKLSTGEDASGTSVFEAPYNSLTAFAVDLNMLTIKLQGKTYTCFPNDDVMQAAAIAGNVAGDQAASIALGAEKVQDAGIPELAERLRLEGVKVSYTNFGRSIEMGVDLGFVVACIISGALVVLVH